MGTRIKPILGDYTKFAEGFDVPLNQVINITFEEVEAWITKDFSEPRRSELHLSHGVSESDIEPFYYLRRHPVLCGLMIFRFSLTMNEIAQRNSNQWGATSEPFSLTLFDFTAPSHFHQCSYDHQDSFFGQTNGSDFKCFH
jgi:hypothetical protein